MESDADKMYRMLLGLDNKISNETVREDYVRAPFSYPGSKARSVRHICPHLPYTDMYCEPFGGSGAVWLARNASKLEIFNDRYAGVTCFFRVVRDRQKTDELLTKLELMVHSREEFIWAQSTWKNCDDEVERAARWYYCVQNSFGAQSLYFGRSKNPKALFADKFHNSLKLFHPLHNRIKNAQVENLDWQVCLHDYNNPECVWYLDPPYYKATTGMYECEMPERDHTLLLDRIQDLDGFVAISAYPNNLYDSYKWDKIIVWEQNTTTLGLAFTGSNGLAEYKDVIARKKAMEVLYVREAKHRD